MWPYPVTTLLPLFFRGLNFSRPLAPAALAEFWRESVVPDLERAVAQTVLYARRDGPLAVLNGLLRAGVAHRSAPPTPAHYAPMYRSDSSEQRRRLSCTCTVCVAPTQRSS